MLRLFLLSLLIIIISPARAASKLVKPQPEKIITVIVDENGLAYIGRDTLIIYQVTEELHNRLWKSFLGTGKMPDIISLKFEGAVSDEKKSAAVKAIKEAQQKTIEEICVHKYKKRFEEIKSKQKTKIKNRFPILFQATFENS